MLIDSHTSQSRFIEELTFNAWPSLQTRYYDGWLLRFANGYTRRSNSINPIYPSMYDTIQKITYCERVYSEQNLTTVYKITPTIYPNDLDVILEQHGYEREAITSVQSFSLENVAQPTIDSVSLTAEPTSAWLDAFCRLNTIHNTYRQTMEQLLNNIAPKKCFLALHHAGEIVSVGLAVADCGYVGLYDIVTSIQWRNQGFGQQTVLHLLNWAKANDVQQAYLQVMTENQTALNLYSKVGFHEIYKYWYRVKQ